eukprot:3103053-Heterocapsa_arctica.AAC.1
MKSDDEQINLKENMDYMKRDKHDIEHINIKEYMDHMKDDQRDIYYIFDENIDRAPLPLTTALGRAQTRPRSTGSHVEHVRGQEAE